MTVAPSGYVLEWCPTHPKATHGVYFQHRLVMECELGRFLLSTETVHHIDHVRTNNQPDNLLLDDNHADHMARHWQGKGRRNPELIERVRKAALDTSKGLSSLGVSPGTVRLICEENDIQWIACGTRGRAQTLNDDIVSEALQERSTIEAATYLGVSVTTIYNRFSHLLTKRAKPGCLDAAQTEILGLVYKQRVSRAEVARRFGVSLVCVTRSIQRWSKQGATLDGSALPEPPRQRPGPRPSRKAPDRDQP